MIFIYTRVYCKPYMSRNPDHTKNINRIHRIQGQLREKNDRREKYCMDILQQPEPSPQLLNP